MCGPFRAWQMRITGLNTILTHAGLRNCLFVQLTTDTGLTGTGEASLEWQERAVECLLQDWVADLETGAGEWPARRGHRTKLAAKTVHNCHGLLFTIMQAALSSVNCGLNPKPSSEKKAFDLSRSRTARLTKIFREFVDAMVRSLV